eukprot:1539941-Pyramimonas_sp.AAC.1
MSARKHPHLPRREMTVSVLHHRLLFKGLEFPQHYRCDVVYCMAAQAAEIASMTASKTAKLTP